MDSGISEQTCASKEQRAKASIIIKRLQEREELRKAEADEAKQSEREINNPNESADGFMRDWRSLEEQAVAELRDLESLGPASGQASAETLQRVTVRVSQLEKDAATATYFLPTFHGKQLSLAAQSLQQRLEACKASAAPKKKFAFSRRALSTASHEAAVPAPSSDPVALQSARSNEPPKADQRAVTLSASTSARLLQGLQDQVVVRFESELTGDDFTLECLQGCTVYLLGSMSAFRASQLSRCKVYTGPIQGAAFLDGIQDCTLVLAASQFRMHRAIRTDVHLRTRSDPIIEQCSQLRFAPYQLQYEDLERQLQESGLAEDTGKWAGVQDFDWLRSSASPNWRLLEVEAQEKMSVPLLRSTS